MKTQIKILTTFLTALAFLLLQSWATAQDTEMLSIHKTSPVTANPGEIITYIIEYSNVGTVEASNVVIKDYLPAANMYTYVGSSPAGTLVGNVLTWDKTNIPELEFLGTGIRQITVQIRAGIPGDGITGSTDGYYMPAPITNITNYTSIESDATNPPIYGDTTNTTVNQMCSVDINNASGVIKSATNTVLYYLMQVNNNGNIYDKFDLSVLNYACIGHDFDPLLSRLLDMNGNEITQTPWIAPFSTYQFLIELTAPIGSNPFHFSCHDLTATSVYCPATSDVGYLETEILGSPKYPLINISKVDSKDPVERGEEFTYIIFVFNSNDKYPAEDFKLYETYDPNIEFVSAVPAPDAGTNNVWSLGTLGYGLDSAETIQVTVRVVDSPICSGTITNMVECSYLNQSRYPTATAITTIFGHPDLAIEKTLVTVPTPAVIGGDVFYTLKYKNAGNCVADNVVLKDFFDNAHLNPVSLNGGIVSGGMIQWNLGSLNPGDSGQIVYSMMVDPTATYNPGVTLVRNYASIITPVPENEYNNNNAMAVFSITLLPDLQVYKSEPDTLFTGVPYTYTITIRNNGDHTASDISLADVLPASLQFVSASDGGVFDAGKITWPLISSLAANTDVIRTVTVIPLCTAIPSVINEANVSCVTLELDYSNNYVAVQSVVVDSISPVITCIPPQEVTTNDACTFVVPNIDWDAIASDNCGIESLSYIISGATSGSGNSLLGVAFNMGVSTVTWTVTDKNGNISTCSFNVMVSDVESPVFVNCPDGSEFVLNTDSAFNTYTHSGFAWDATASDNCGIDSLYFVMTGATIGSGSSLDGVVFNMGETTVLWTAADLSGNTIYCEFTVVVNDNQNPEFSFCLTGNNQSVNTDLGADTYTQPDASWDAIAGDNDGIASLTYVLSGATIGSGTSLAGVAFNIGTTTITFIAVDSSGNEALCVFDVLVTDNQLPEYSFCLTGNNQSVNTDLGADTYTHPDASWDAIAGDNDGIASLTYVLSGATTGSGTSLAGVVFNLGTTTITFTAVDSTGNVALCAFDVVVSDNENPVYSFCLTGNNQTVNTDPGVNTYTHPDASWDAIAGDNDGIASLTYVLSGATTGSGTSLAGVVFNLGTTTVTFLAVDNTGNEAMCIFDIIVVDNQDPEFSFCLAGNDQTGTTDPGTDTYTHPDASWDAIAGDNDGIADLTYSLSGATTGSGTTLAGVVFNLGTTSVVWTATDNSGNITLCEYNVIVVDDEAPVITCPPSQFYCSVDAVDIGNATATDNVYVISLTNNAPSVFPVGTTVVVWTATDAYGNTSTCEQVIVVTQISSVFAGNDAEFCQGTTFYKIKDSWASDYSGLLWTVEQGDGYFDDPTLMNATYYPPSSENGTVVLKLTAFSHGTCPNTTDEMNLIIDVKPILTAEEPDAICSGDEIGLNVEGADSYVWNPGGMTGSNVMVSPNESTSYTVIGMSKDGCLDTIEINLVVKPSPDVELVSSAYDVYIGDEVFLQASGADYYTWNLDNLFGDHGSLTITETTVVEVYGEAGNGCHGSDTIEIRILGYHALKIPEGYSPNADGIHDKFDIVGIEAFPSNWLKVYNRWGSIVYESSGYHNEWDGFSNSKLQKGSVKLPEGTYYYILDLGDGSELLSGSVYISR